MPPLLALPQYITVPLLVPRIADLTVTHAVVSCAYRQQ
jgi:hypothetical protein